MRSAVMLFLCLVSIPLSADTPDEDFVQWKEWVLKEIRIPEEKDNTTVKIKLKDGREFEAVKKNDNEYTAKLEFGSFTVNKSEIESISPSEIREKIFLKKINAIVNCKSPAEFLSLRKEFRLTKQVQHFLNWWLLYLNPEDITLQTKTSLAKTCETCKGAGKYIDDTLCPLVNCERCKGGGKVSCSMCKGSCYTTCTSCKGTGFAGKVIIQEFGLPDSVLTTKLCPKCKGKKQFVCKSCKGKGQYICSTCKGERKVRIPIRCKHCSGKGRLLFPSEKIIYPFLKKPHTQPPAELKEELEKQTPLKDPKQ